MGFSSGTICGNRGLDFPQLKKRTWCCKASAMEPEQSTDQVTLNVQFPIRIINSRMVII